MNFNNKKVLISSHSDLDGLFPIILSKKYYDILNHPDLWMNNYDDIDYKYNELKNYDIIIYPDFSPNEQCRKIIEENNIQCYILDHHVAVYNELIEWTKTYNNVEYTYSEIECGSKLYYKWLLKNFNIEKNTVIEEVIELVNTYDTWKKDSPLWIQAQNLNRLLYKSIDYKINTLDKYNLFISMMTMKFDNDEHFKFNRLEEAKIQQDIDKENEMFFEIISSPKNIKTRKDDKGRYFAIIKCSSKISAICNRILEKYKKLDYVIALNTYSQANGAISLRSKDINLLELEHIKGHENAAGYQNATEEDQNNIWSGKVYSIPYKE